MKNFKINLTIGQMFFTGNLNRDHYITKMILPVIGSLPLPKGIEVKAPYINVQL